MSLLFNKTVITIYEIIHIINTLSKLSTGNGRSQHGLQLQFIVLQVNNSHNII